MGRVSSTAASTLGTGVTNPTLSTETVTADTEYTITLPLGTRKFYIKHRTSGKFEVRYIESSTEYFSNKGGNIFTRDNLAPTTQHTLYITPKKSGVLEIESWA